VFVLADSIRKGDMSRGAWIRNPDASARVAVGAAVLPSARAGGAVSSRPWDRSAFPEFSMQLNLVSAGRNPPAEINVIVEVPVGGEPIKYEMDKESGALVVDRFLYTSMRYPGNYGFIPRTLSDDGDPCDVLIANQRGIIPGAIVAARPVGVLKMQDEAGGDEKILAVPATRLTRRYENVQDYTDLPEITIQQVQHFFEHYKDLEKSKWVKVIGWGDAAEARGLIVAALERFRRASGA
jgi:inorganic pyrophosphatase